MARTHIVIHHSAGKDSVTRDWDAIREMHLGKGWKDIGYHYGIEEEGSMTTVMTGRSLDNGGAHCPQQGMNRKGIGICVVGNFEIAPPSPQKISALASLCVKLCREHDIPVKNILPHSHFKNTLCCGRYFPLDYLKNLITARLRGQE